MKELLKGFWKAIHNLILDPLNDAISEVEFLKVSRETDKAACDWLTLIICAALEFIDGVFETVADFFCDMFSGIVELISKGVARLWVILFPNEGDADEDDNVSQLHGRLTDAIDKKNKASNGKFSLGQGRFVVKTDNNNQIQADDDIKAFFNTRGSSMNGLDIELKKQG